MSTPKIIVSYDGTNNEDDAIALGRVLAGAGAEIALAYVRHTQEPEPEREMLAQREAEELLQRGAELLGERDVARHVVADRSTPEGLRALAEREGADAVVFCSDSHTAPRHIAVGNSAQRLLDGGRVAVAIAPAGLADSADGAAADRRHRGPHRHSAQSNRAGARRRARSERRPRRESQNADLLVVGSRPRPGRGGALSAAAHAT